MVVRGAAEVTLIGKVEHVHENESIYLPIGSTHRLANPGKIDLELIEVQTGSYFGEDDIVRIDDDYAGIEAMAAPLTGAAIEVSPVPGMPGGQFHEYRRDRCRCRATRDPNSW